MQRFAEQMAALEDSPRCARRPFPARDPVGTDCRTLAAAVLQAEIRHATDDFWCEARARIAWASLGDLNMHDGDARGAMVVLGPLGPRAQTAMGTRATRAEAVLVRPAAYRAARAALALPQPKAA